MFQKLVILSQKAVEHTEFSVKRETLSPSPCDTWWGCTALAAWRAGCPTASYLVSKQRGFSYPYLCLQGREAPSWKRDLSGHWSDTTERISDPKAFGSALIAEVFLGRLVCKLQETRDSHPL